MSQCIHTLGRLRWRQSSCTFHQDRCSRQGGSRRPHADTRGTATQHIGQRAALYLTALPRPAQVVVLSQVLACDATLGYEELYNVQVLRCNGEPVRNLRHLARLCLACAAPFMRFDLDYDVRRPCASARVPACIDMRLA